MNTSVKQSDKSSSVVVGKPIVPTLISFGSDLAERGVTTYFDLLQEARSELKSVTDATIGYADSMSKSALGLARTFSAQLDRVASAGIDQSRAAAIDVIAALRNTGNRTASLAAVTVDELVGERSSSAA